MTSEFDIDADQEVRPCPWVQSRSADPDWLAERNRARRQFSEDGANMARIAS
jgi:hypothetical protein